VGAVKPKGIDNTTRGKKKEREKGQRSKKNKLNLSKEREGGKKKKNNMCEQKATERPQTKKARLTTRRHLERGKVARSCPRRRGEGQTGKRNTANQKGERQQKVEGAVMRGEGVNRRLVVVPKEVGKEPSFRV